MQAATVAFLKRLSKQTLGRFHVFRGDLFDVPDEGLTSLCESEEVSLLRNEVQLAGATLATIRALMVENEQRKNARSAQVASGDSGAALTVPKAETASARAWLEENSVAKLKLTYYDALRPSVYRHASGHVDILQPKEGATPEDLFGAHVEGAEHNSRRVHAELCQDLTLLKWRDGTMVRGAEPPTETHVCRVPRPHPRPRPRHHPGHLNHL